MPHDRFFVSFSLANRENHEVMIENEDELHHLRTVMKCREGDLIEIIDGKGHLGVAIITHMMKKSCNLRINSLSFTPKPRFAIHVALAITRSSHLEFALEKCVEVGADSFCIFKGDYSERQIFSESTTRRIFHIVQSALKQSGRLYLPTISLLNSLDEAFIKAPTPIFYGDISPFSKKPAEILKQMLDEHEPLQHKASIFIGPERGWSEREKTLLRERSPHGAITLSDAVLRAETAAVVGCHMVKEAFETIYDFPHTIN